MTEIVDEFFEHPVPKNDDIMDALYYADYYAKAPISGITSADNIGEENMPIRSVKRYYNWLTGAKV